MTLDGRKVILLAEDDPDQRDVLREVLEFEDYEVWTASSPAEALVRLGQGPDAVLLDLLGVASPEVVEALAGWPRRPAVLLVSADPELPAIAARLGLEGYLSKPYDLEHLLQLLAKVLEGRTPARVVSRQWGWAGGP